MAYFLFLSLFLQSCDNSFNQLAPKVEISSNDSTNIVPLKDQEFVSEGGHLVTFHEKEGDLQADVERNIPKGFSKEYMDLPVGIAQDIDVTQLSHLDKEAPKRIMHLNPPRSAQPDQVSIFEEGPKWEMKKDNEDKGKEKEKEKEVEKTTVLIPQTSLNSEILNSQVELLMRYSDYLDPKFIPLCLVSTLLKVSSEVELNAILAKLEGLSLITIISERSKAGIQIHQKVEGAYKAYQDCKDKNKLSEQDLLLLLVQALHQCMPVVSELPDSTWDQAKLCANSVAYVLVNVGKNPAPNSSLVHLFNRMGRYNNIVIPNHKQALIYYQQTLKMRKALYSDNHPDVAKTLDDIGVVYHNLGQYEEALGYYQQALTMKQSLNSGNHLDIVKTSNNIGLAYQRLGQYEEALKYFQQGTGMNSEILNSQARLLMRYAVYLDPNFIPLCLVSALLKVSNKAELNAILCWSEKLSLITIMNRSSGPGIRINLKVQAACKEYQGWKDKGKLPEQDLLLSLVQALHQCMPVVSELADSTWDQAKLYANSVAYVLVNVGKNPAPSPLLAHLFNCMGRYNTKVILNYKQALIYYQQTLKMRKALYSDNHLDIAKTLNDVGVVYQELGQYEEALGCYQQALTMKQSLNSDNHPNIAKTLSNIGSVYQKLGKHEEASKYFKQGIEMNLKTLDSQAELLMRYAVYLDPDFIPLCLASALLKVSNEAELNAILAKLRKLSLITLLNGSSGPGIRIESKVQAACKEYQGWKDKDKLSEQDLLLSLIEVLHEHMPVVAEASDSTWDQAKLYANSVAYVLAKLPQEVAASSFLTDLFDRMGSYHRKIDSNYKQAWTYYLKSLAMKQVLYTDIHPDIAMSLHNLGSVYDDLDQRTESLKYYQQALEMRKTLYSDSHPDIAKTLNNMGCVYQKLGESEEALKYFQQAIEMDSTSASANYNIGVLYYNLSKYEEALKYLQRALEMYQALYEGNHPDIADTWYALGALYYNLSKYEEALKYYQQALEMRKTLYPDNHPDIDLTRVELYFTTLRIKWQQSKCIIS